MGAVFGQRMAGYNPIQDLTGKRHMQHKSMIFLRRWAAASETKSGLVITGGVDASSNKLTSTVMYSPMLTWTALPDLPIATYVHCQITVDNIVYIIGGGDGQR